MLEYIGDFSSQLLDSVLSLLPHSPFQSFIHLMEDLPYLGYLNWLLPIGTFIAIGQAWLVAIGCYYIYSIILRWLRAID